MWKGDIFPEWCYGNSLQGHRREASACRQVLRICNAASLPELQEMDASGRAGNAFPNAATGSALQQLVVVVQ